MTHARPTVAVSALVQGVAGGLARRALLAGRAVDRFGARTVGAVGLLVGAVACAVRAAASSAFAPAAWLLMSGEQLGFVAPAITRAIGDAVQHGGPAAFFGAFAIAHLSWFPALRLAETGPRARVHPTRVDFNGATA